MRLGSETGSLVNHVMTNSKQVEPVVGMGVTICMWSDRHAGTIVKVTPKQIHVQEDTATRIDKNGMSESQEYTYTPNTAAPIQIFRLTKRGWRNSGGSSLGIGYRRKYHDYSF